VVSCWCSGCGSAGTASPADQGPRSWPFGESCDRPGEPAVVAAKEIAIGHVGGERDHCGGCGELRSGDPVGEVDVQDSEPPVAAIVAA
jgi:hypothetical protein